MSAKTDVESAGAVSACDGPEPRPWETPADRRGWRTHGHGRRFGTPPQHLQLEIDLDDAQAAWVIQESQRAGVGPAAFVKSLIDGARSAAG